MCEKDQRDHNAAGPSPIRGDIGGGAYGKSIDPRFLGGADHPRAVAERDIRNEAQALRTDREPARASIREIAEKHYAISNHHRKQLDAAARVLDVLREHPYLEQFIYDLQTLGVIR